MKNVLLATLSIAGCVFAQQRPSDVIATKAGDVRITPLNHASLLLQLGQKAVYADPVGQANYAGLPKADLILLTDIHGDHLAPKTIDELKQAGTRIIGPPAVQDKLPETQALANGQSTTWEGIRIDAIAAYNIERGPTPGVKYHEKGRGNGYLLTFGGKRIYIAGDTECTPEMKALKNVDVAFLPMNLPYTMPVDEAAACVKAFRPKVVYPYHYRGSDLKAFESALKDEKGIEVRLREWY
jgi:L-ascorbate metabolism protein UlaG (beta-lactamase superfamily)